MIEVKSYKWMLGWLKLYWWMLRKVKILLVDDGKGKISTDEPMGKVKINQGEAGLALAGFLRQVYLNKAKFRFREDHSINWMKVRRSEPSCLEAPRLSLTCHTRALGRAT